MADLADLLGTAYSRQPAARAVPEWSDDEHLERAFASWRPGPGPDAPAAERKMFVSSTRQARPDAGEAKLSTPETAMKPTDPSPADPFDLSDLPNSASREGVVSPEAEPADAEPRSLPVVNAAPNSTMPWTRQEDDVLVGRSRFSVRLSLRRR